LESVSEPSGNKKQKRRERGLTGSREVVASRPASRKRWHERRRKEGGSACQTALFLSLVQGDLFDIIDSRRGAFNGSPKMKKAKAK
jgi:hypothetical protein